MTSKNKSTHGAVGVALLCSLSWGCSSDSNFDAENPARGPGQLVGNGEPVSDGNFRGGNDTLPAPRVVAQPPIGEEAVSCDSDCATYCENSGLENPVNQALCGALWGVGLDARPIATTEACRRLYVDMLGTFPSSKEIADTCEGKEWGTVVKDLMSREEFLFVNRRRFADRYLYNTQTVSVERIYDFDELVQKTMRGLVPYDLFAAVASAHPVVTRRYNTADDIAEAVFEDFIGRPPFENERADLARLYALWTNGYYDHSGLNMRLPDAYVEYKCVDDDGNPDPETRGQCTSVLLGFNELILRPDSRAQDLEYGDEISVWSGLLRSEEWEELQAPGRLLATRPAFWEKVVEDVLIQYLGYNLGTNVPEVRDALVRYLFDYNADLRSLHFAVLTSVAYLQSAQGASPSDHRWTFGPHKQATPEIWLDSMKRRLDLDLGSCDHRLSRPQDFAQSQSIGAYALLKNSNWVLSDEGNVRMDYADIARVLGGCPDNEASGRFEVVSILSTSAQLNFVNDVCAPAGGAPNPADANAILPSGLSPTAATDQELARTIFNHQSQLFLGRKASTQELATAQTAGQDCANAQCTAEDFARAACFAVLSSGEMLFY